MKIYAFILVCGLTYYYGLRYYLRILQEKVRNHLKVLCNAEMDKEKVLAMANECKAQVGATDADVDAMLKHEAAGSTEAKCLRACVMKKVGILSEDGKLVKEVALQLVTAMANGDAEKEASGAAVVAACEGIEVSGDHCEAAEEYGTCAKREAESRGLTDF